VDQVQAGVIEWRWGLIFAYSFSVHKIKQECSYIKAILCHEDIKKLVTL